MKLILRNALSLGILFSSIFFLTSSCTNAMASGGTETVKVQTSANCGTCKRTIEKALHVTVGVKKATLDLDDKVVTVKYDPEKTDEDKIRLAIVKSGYDADDQIADQEAHDSLPDCCQKGADPH